MFCQPWDYSGGADKSNLKVKKIAHGGPMVESEQLICLI